jgi:hypothetical protein
LVSRASFLPANFVDERPDSGEFARSIQLPAAKASDQFLERNPSVGAIILRIDAEIGAAAAIPFQFTD